MVHSDSELVEEVEVIEEQRQREWTGAVNRSGVIRFSNATSPNSSIPLLLDTESWSFHFTPDVRYGREPLLQGYQLHRHHLHRWGLNSR